VLSKVGDAQFQDLALADVQYFELLLVYRMKLNLQLHSPATAIQLVE
jgi:hypothetical protein